MPFTVRLRSDVFTKAARLAGFRSDYALAKEMEINRSTVARVLSGHLNPGPAFIAGSLTALTPMQFDDLFEIVQADAELDTHDDEQPGTDGNRRAASHPGNAARARVVG